MTDVYTQESASKKKFLAPLLVILLCMVSLTAAGYAYSATVDNTDDTIIVEGITMELKNGDDIVTTPMYDLEFAVATHTVNGKAIYNNQGFLESNTTAPEEYDSEHTYATGYYVETLYRIGNEGAFAPVESGAIAITPEYKLVVDNEASSTVNLTVSLTTADEVPTFVSKIYVVVTEVVGVDETAKVATAYLAGTPEQGETATITLDEGADTYIVQAYFVASDFYSNSAGLASLIPAECEFAINFTAATA